MIVDFFVCGVQKGGTTALDAFLRQHPAIEMAAVKEPHFFDDETVDWRAPDTARLHRHYAEAGPPRRRGEATPITSYWPNALERLKAYNPSARLILLLRHPAARALSHWRMERARGAESLPFAAAIRAGRARVEAAGGVHRVFSYVERGFYAAQVERMLALFPRRRILFLRTDALWTDPAATLATVYRFLGLEPGPEVGRRYIAPVVVTDRAALSPADADTLQGLYAEDIVRTQERTGLDLRDWLAPGAAEREPMGAGN